MKAMITGMNGAVAPFVYKELLKRGIEVIVWDRSKVPTDDAQVVYDYIKETNPDVFFQIATGPVEWLQYIAKATNELGIKLLFTSTVSVFSEKGTGPYTVESTPNAEEDYGRYKIECEETVRKYHQNAVILRLGWQIGTEAGSNNMIDFLERSFKEHGAIEASSKWYPSTSFLPETARIIVEAALEYSPDTYLVNSNQKFHFYEIVNYLMEKHKANWEIKEVTHFQRDDRMFDQRINIAELF
ncbi:MULTISPECIES: sugar nucleotide-binding protein [unclassified Bacillus (in: firmicutes)]|uniref:sugar nucleotide-binding protein n=1 Tax=unclassified Bacillus (in: firmicutes) TaxID=185979 RepID=UPI0008E8C261|nr:MULTISPECIES: sugar nucleotide-binding protein [unclassified Bacillus (in: firmicutes)]SFB09472.1 dTDP-4-dehydrorhamnose reductase [Bacillus sp. UNCCL13]SFQ86689.1 dTDP-4-dehydrorhamnose reductase [Bacillus sp. cl95]